MPAFHSVAVITQSSDDANLFFTNQTDVEHSPLLRLTRWPAVETNFWAASLKASLRQMYPRVVRLSVCLLHSRTLLKPLSGRRCHLPKTLVWSQVILY